MTSLRTGILKVIARPGHEIGFRLGGAPVAVVSDRDELNREIAAALDEGDIGVLAIPLDMEPWLSDRNFKALERIARPILLRYDCESSYERLFRSNCESGRPDGSGPGSLGLFHE
ncbi:MAG: hypothetical protein HYU64_04405 [Armatimonadetes bacterium]|nr:hypothetical protein [Armatimonadota bacterium]